VTNHPLSRRGLLGAATIGAFATDACSKTPTAQAPIARLEASTTPIPVAFLVDQGATVIDFAGPWEVFQDVGGGAATFPFRLFTVAPSAGPIWTTGNFSDGQPRGLQLTPDFTFETAPPPKVVVMGAQAHIGLPAKRDWIRRVAPQADVILSVCTGAFVLAGTGLIDGLSATTHHDFYDLFEKSFPKVTLVRGRRFVDNGKFISAGGLTSGIDAALHVVARYLSEEAASRTAHYMEHDSSGWETGVRA
jgi:transcriptional regulator GlxA family with amidase domain